MAKKVEIERIEEFFENRNLLEHYDDWEIAQRMGLRKSSFSSYINRRYPITNVFLKKFYAAFEEELKMIREKAIVYIKPDDTTEAQIKRVKVLERKAEKLVESHELIIMDIRRLEQKLDHIIDARLEKMETLLANLVAGEKSPVSENAGEKGKKKSGTEMKPKKRKPRKGSSGEGKSPK